MTQTGPALITGSARGVTLCRLCRGRDIPLQSESLNGMIPVSELTAGVQSFLKTFPKKDSLSA